MRDSNSKMPSPIGDVYDALDRQLSWYQRTLSVVYDLYVDKPKNVEVFNELASDFFGFMQSTLIDSLIVQLGRLTDPAKNRVQDNLSFKRLVSMIDASQYPSLNAEITNYLSQIEKHCVAARTHRHKRVAHTDLNVALTSSALPVVILLDFREALTAGRNLLNAVAAHFDGVTVSHTVAPAPGGAHSLMKALERAKELKEQDSFKYHMGFERKSTANS